MTTHVRIVHSFDLEAAVTQGSSVSTDAIYRAEGYIAAVIYESFVISADEDYVTASLLALNGLPRGFFWAAAQAVEKYAKAILLLAGESVRSETRHQLPRLIRRALLASGGGSLRDLESAAEIPLPQGYAVHLQSMPAMAFIEVINREGSSSNRYNAAGVEYDTSFLFLLDHLIAQLRGLMGTSRNLAFPRES